MSILTRTRPLRSLAILLAGSALLLAACDTTEATDDSEDASPTPTASETAADPTPTTTPEPTLTGTPPVLPTQGTEGSDAAGGGIEPANPVEPPEGDLESSQGSVPLGLGTYCWSPPTGSGHPALCADMIGIITATEDLVVQPGATLEVTGELTMPPMRIISAFLYPAPDAPVEPASPDFRAWQPDVPASEEQALEHGDHSVTLPEDLEPGARYVLAINYSAGPDRGSDAMYGAVLEVQQ